MFECVIEQAAAEQIAADFESRKLPPSILFAGPEASGKGSAALELGRVLSCEKDATDDCRCPSCVRHSKLSHPDMLCMGARNFSAEIAAAAAAFGNAHSDAQNAALVFVRALKKLLARFAIPLWEDDPKFGKLAPQAAALEEAADEIASLPEAAKKRIAVILKDALKLEADGITNTIPINQIRRAAAWAHLAPNGARKTLIIENADRMQEGARNSLLKLLEEPPETLTIILTTSREQALLQTILSRVRPYRFTRRSRETEAAVIRQVFGTPSGIGASRGGITAYLESFLPVSDKTLRPAAALFASSAAAITVMNLRRFSTAADLPLELIALGKHASAIAESSGLGRHIQNPRVLIDKLLLSAQNFEIRGLFSRFLRLVLDIVSESFSSLSGAFSPACLDIWRNGASVAASSTASYNQRPAAALNRLLSSLTQEMTELYAALTA